MSSASSRWPGFIFAILSGFIGTPVGNHNFSIVFVWIVWWALLMLIVVPFLGRGWCAICPIPMPGEWLQNGALLKPRGKGFGLNRKWPKRFRNIWLQNIAFTLLALFSAVVLTQPSVTGVVLLLFLIVALVTSLIFERRAFCRYLCPVGGFIGLYSQVAPVEVRVKDPAVCAVHTEKSCYTGSKDGYGCPWLVYPGTLTKNINCGLCMECLRTCTQDNVAFNLRSFGADLQTTGRPQTRRSLQGLHHAGRGADLFGGDAGAVGGVEVGRLLHRHAAVAGVCALVAGFDLCDSARHVLDRRGAGSRIGEIERDR